MLPGSDVRLLLTSREALQLEEEWLYTVSGSDFEVDIEDAGAESAAVQLFVERARRVKPNFPLDHETDAVETICRLVEGMPLAIELAAAWTGYLSCADIAAEIERDLSFLSSHLRNLPERHRSIQAIFDQTWKQLTCRGEGGLLTHLRLPRRFPPRGSHCGNGRLPRPSCRSYRSFAAALGA